MKKITQLKTGIVLAALFTLTGCSLFGTNPIAPTSFERSLFDIQTNQTQVVTTSPTGGLVTNIVLSFTFTTKPATKETVQAGGTAVNTIWPGIGSIVSMGVLGLLGLWAQLRGNKKSDTAVAVAQEVETIREFIKTLPSGTKIDTAITSWLQAHQLATGTASQVLGILSTSVNNDQAKGAVNEIKQAIDAASKP
jgi:hypothetical protein